MVNRRIVIVGGVAGGASAAAKARRVDEKAEIRMYERGPYISFANCGLPYYISGKIKNRDALFVTSPEFMKTRFNVNVFTRHEVTAIDRSAKTISVRNTVNNQSEEVPYDKLVIATGAAALKPPIPGINGRNVFPMKIIEDMDRLNTYIKRQMPDRAVVVGGGFIGLEMVEALHSRGLAVTVVELANHLLPPLDEEIAHHVESYLNDRGVHIVLADGVKEFHGNPDVTEVVLNSGRRLPADLVLLTIGIRPEIKIAKDAGLALGPKGELLVNELMETSDPDIYGAGDITAVRNLVTALSGRVPLAGPANKQGRVAGANAAGGSLTFKGAMGTSIVGVLGLAAGRTGINEKEAKAANLDYFVSYTHSNDHASYYPGSEQMGIKLIVQEQTGRLLGAQVVGKKAIDKTIDVFATAIHAGMTVEDLEDLDLAYAPQFSSAKGPVNMAGFVAANRLRLEAKTIAPEALKQKLEAGNPPLLFDVRSPAEFAGGSIGGAKNIPLDEMRDRYNEVPSDRDVVVYCLVGLRGYVAARILSGFGYDRVFNLSGGLKSWRCCTFQPI